MDKTVNNLRKSYTKMINGVDYMRNHIEKILHLAHNFIIIISERKQTICGVRQLKRSGGDRGWEQGNRDREQGRQRLGAGI